MKPPVLFDLGNTLARYYHADEFQPILKSAIGGVLSELRSRGLTRVSFEEAMTAAIGENREAPDYRFSPMAERFERIFDAPLAAEPSLAEALCGIFLRPIFEIGRVYEDTFPVLEAIRRAGHRTAIVSNAPWGSPPALWRAEMERLGLTSAVDELVFCGDVGRRKPAPAIFEFAAQRLERRPNECIFVGDDQRWDISGSQALGMRAILIDRDARHLSHEGIRIDNLHGLLEHI
jgi:FMN phosphatase YigB (HAD superfamily)